MPFGFPSNVGGREIENPANYTFIWSYGPNKYVSFYSMNLKKSIEIMTVSVHTGKKFGSEKREKYAILATQETLLRHFQPT